VIAILDGLPPDARRRVRRTPQPAWVDPMLATLTDRRFSDPNWIFETKLDGERCLAFKRGSTVRLLSRNQQLLNNTYPEVVEALERAGSLDVLIDGEIVAFDGKRTSFEKLQGRIGIKDPDAARRSGIPVFYYVFDLVHVDGFDITRVELILRKGLLRKALNFRGAVRFETHRNTEGERFYREACAKGLEGVIAKRRDSEYAPGKRSPDWLKFKCVNEQEFVIGGFTDPAGSRLGFGALLVGYYERGRLRYAGKVGTGFDTATLLSLRRKLDARRTSRSPFADEVREKGAHWVKPELVAQIGFSEWTRDGKLRHPRFLGLRTDKGATEVVRERPQST
jgi:bifunctional non-homologous end joining protein LigD